MIINPEKLSNYLTKIEFKDNGDIIGSYACTTGQTILMRIVFPEYFPIELPKFFVENLNELKLFIPHLEQNGLICYTTANNVVFDNSNPEQLAEVALKKAIATLETGIQKLNRSDFRKEFIAFWDQQSHAIPVSFFAVPDDKVKFLNVFYSDDNLIVNDKNSLFPETVNRFFPGNIEPFNHIEAIYFPLRMKNNIMPPNPTQPWSKKEILNCVRKNSTQSNKCFFEKWISKKTSKIKIVFLKIPLEQNNEVIIGFQFQKSTKSLKKHTGKITPILVRRFDLDYLLERTSGEHKFTNLNICIIGLGSVGSKLTTELANLGITKMTIIDPERFEPDNMFRHSLGADSIRKGKLNFKVEELRLELERKNPYLEVETEALNVLKILKQDPHYFDRYDYTFVCIGDTMTSLELNRIFSENNSKIFYSWVEPLGIGGHVLYVDYNQLGCFRCLYTNLIDGKVVPNRAALVKPGQHIEKNLASCRSAFVPYNSLTSSEAAIKTAELFHKVIYNRITENSILTWLGDIDTFKEMGYEFSDRFSGDLSQFPTIEASFHNSKCIVCGENS